MIIYLFWFLSVSRYYNFLYFNTLRPAAYHIVERLQNCEDILMNFIVSDVTKLPPIKVTHRKVSKETMLPGKAVTDPNYYQTRFKQRQGCVASLTEIFGYMPLVRSRSRMDPVLWKDPVSNLRKKYRQLEVIWLLKFWGEIWIIVFNFFLRIYFRYGLYLVFTYKYIFLKDTKKEVQSVYLYTWIVFVSACHTDLFMYRNKNAFLLYSLIYMYVTKD